MESYQIRTELYNASSLYEGFDPDNEDSYSLCYDGRVYADYLQCGSSCSDVRITLARTLHDHSISECMHRFLSNYDLKNVVGIMGGHQLDRTSSMFREIVLLSKTLTERGKIMTSGGGPGAMEATHLGAWMAGRSVEEVDDALSILSVAPNYKDRKWLSSAFKVLAKYPQAQYRSLGIPTWLYGHEPATPFATDIAKYYANSVREDNILSIAVGGIIFTPGSAGTLQEIFQEAAQDHYVTCGISSPMFFLGKAFFTEEVPVYPFLVDMMERGKYKNLLLSISDSAEEAVETIMNF